MSAVVIPDGYQCQMEAFLLALRANLGRRPTDHLTWKNLRSHGERVYAAREMGSQNWLKVSSVVVCKRHLGAPLPSEDSAYLYTLRYLLERLSWLARDNAAVLTYTVAHIVRFKLATLREYETALKSTAGVNIDWPSLDPAGGRIDQPQRLDGLQLGDLAASATGQAFERDRFGNTEQRYLQEIAPRLYRRGSGTGRLTSYGLKMHPWTETTKAAYPWVAAL